VPIRLGAQDSTLDAVEVLVREGSTEEARALIRAWWAAPVPDAPAEEVQRALWLKGRLTLDPAAAAADYGRLVEEFPGGPYSDRALWRLALAAEARHDLASATEHYRALAVDYASRPSGRNAEAWLAANGPRSAPTVQAAVAGATAGPTLERARPAPKEEPSPPAAEGGAVADARPRQSAATGPFTVQIGAYLSEARASRMTERVTESGFAARIVHVPGSPLFRVRVGRFGSAAAAVPVADSIGKAGFATYITDNAATERPYR
jgi:cell division septation protein DedD